jgi:hypothetical protein
VPAMPLFSSPARATITSATAIAAAVLAIALTGAVAAGPADAATASHAVTHATDPDTHRSVVVRWTPCLRMSGVTSTHPISYAVNTGGDASRVTLVQHALAQVTAVSGLRFRYVGTVSYVPHYAVLHYPSGDRLMFNAAQQRAVTHAELVVGWVSATRTNMFSDDEAGVGTVSWTGSARSQLRIVESAALIKIGVRLRPGFTSGASVGSLLLHEIGHAVGLDHVTARTQIMYPALGAYTPASYQSGDRTGLRLVGRSAGCFVTPALSPPDPMAIARAAGISVTV